MQLNDNIIELNQITQAVRDAHTRITDVYDVADTALTRVGDVSVRMDAFEDRQEAIDNVLSTWPLKPARDRISGVMWEYGERHGYSVHNVFDHLFFQFKKENGIDLRELSKDSTDMGPFDIAEKFGAMDKLYILTVKLFVGR